MILWGEMSQESARGDKGQILHFLFVSTTSPLIAILLSLLHPLLNPRPKIPKLTTPHTAARHPIPPLHPRIRTIQTKTPPPNAPIPLLLFPPHLPLPQHIRHTPHTLPPQKKEGTKSPAPDPNPTRPKRRRRGATRPDDSRRRSTSFVPNKTETTAPTPNYPCGGPLPQTRSASSHPGPKTTRGGGDE
jgi:hypothetical protein